MELKLNKPDLLFWIKYVKVVVVICLINPHKTFQKVRYLKVYLNGIIKLNLLSKVVNI